MTGPVRAVRTARPVRTAPPVAPPSGSPAPVAALALDARHSRASATPRLLSWTRIIVAGLLLVLGIVGVISLDQNAALIAEGNQHAEQSIRLYSIGTKLVQAQNAGLTSLVATDRQTEFETKATDALADVARLTVEASANPVTSDDQVALETVAASVADYTGKLNRVVFAGDSASKTDLAATSAALDKLLKTIDDLRTTESDRAAALLGYSALSAPLVIAIVALVALLAATAVLARASHRVLNVGLLVAAGCAVTIIAGVASLAHGMPGATAGFDAASLNSSIRRDVALIYRIDIEAIATQSSSGVDAQVKTLTNAARAGVASLQQFTGDPAPGTWLTMFSSEQSKVSGLLNSGKWADAATEATADTTSSLVKVAASLDETLVVSQDTSLPDARAEVNGELLALRVWTWLVAGFALAGTIAAWLGVGARLKEYR